jgi:regulatory protein
MARVTALEPDPRRPGALRVLVDGKLFCTVDQAAVRSEGLAVGVEWDGARAAGAGRAADVEAAWRAVLRALERRPHAVADLRRRLQQKGHTPEALDQALARALQTRLLDDAEFSRGFVASRSERGRGPARLRRDLRALGVADEHIERAIAGEWQRPEDLLARATELARKRARQLAGVPREARRRRLVAYLARRGFSGSGVVDLVGRVLRADGASEPDRGVGTRLAAAAKHT